MTEVEEGVNEAPPTLIMFYDTETTGKSDFRASYNAQHQPNVVQLGYKIVEPVSRATIFEIGHLVNSTQHQSWNGIEPDAQAIHHITEDQVRKFGMSMNSSISLFQRWANRCRLFVAHNEQFDNGMVQCLAYRANWNPGVFQDKQKFCTMKSSTNICMIPNPNGKGGYKWPKLNEAYPFFMKGEQFKEAHNALADVNACADIFWRMVDARFIPNVVVFGEEGASSGTGTVQATS